MSVYVLMADDSGVLWILCGPHGLNPNQDGKLPLFQTWRSRSSKPKQDQCEWSYSGSSWTRGDLPPFALVGMSNDITDHNNSQQPAS